LLAINSTDSQKYKLFLLKMTFLLTLISSVAEANCNFVSANYLTDLNSPNAIRSINIQIPKSGKFNKNFAKIVVSNSKNIPPKLKKKFKANVTVNYNFGRCVYKAKVKQNGDWKDHVGFTIGGKPLRSLKVKLENGNILNAVKFKLLIPDTRNDIHEVLGTLLLRELGFIAPETFQVKTIINDVDSFMLFQEDASKEMLERSSRREGPLFEGDESLLWSFKDYKNFSLEPIALSRMTNKNWFLKGKSSQYITLYSYEKLQKAYIDYSQNLSSRKQLIIFPNGRDDKVFQEYFITLLAMNGAHALRPHNRKFYFNSFTSQFEPVYYDGDLRLDLESIEFSGHFKLENKLLQQVFTDSFKSKYKNPFKKFDESSKVLLNFQDRVLIKDEDAKQFFKIAISNIRNNIDNLINKIQNLESLSLDTLSFIEQKKSYYDKQKLYNLKQEVISSLRKVNGSYLGITQDGRTISIEDNEVAKIISTNDIDNNRTVYIPNASKNDFNYIKNFKFLESIEDNIIHSQGLKFFIDKFSKKIIFTQTNSSDWVLIKGVNLSGWTLSFVGVERIEINSEKHDQRFNFYGMTGCLNFYNTIFNDTFINAIKGACEDSVNIVNSYGNINKIEIEKAYSDALDIDFSRVNINIVKVMNAGNDCIDLSGGTYIVQNVIANNCGDKGVSVGEKSNVTLENLIINNSVIGVSSKDLSSTKVNKAQFVKVKYCYESAQKKQEFGGARLEFGIINCKKGHIIDSNSLVLIGIK